MRLRIAHSIVHRYDPPAPGAIQVLRLTPRNHEGQHVIDWRIDVSTDARLSAHEDAFGNLTHVFSADGPLEELVVKVDGEVETQNTDGMVRGAVERFPPSLFLRDTALTQADAAIRTLAHEASDTPRDSPLAALHALLKRVHGVIAHDREVSQANASAIEAFAHKRGGAGELAHIFIGAAHCLAIPARYVAGYRCTDGGSEQPCGFAWAEAYVPDLGWVGFDPANGICPTESYVRVAVGLDGIGAAPVRAMRRGAGVETSAVAITVDQ